MSSLDGQRRAADVLLRLGAYAVLVKGAHVEGDTFTDLLATTSTEHLFPRGHGPLHHGWVLDPKG